MAKFVFLVISLSVFSLFRYVKCNVLGSVLLDEHSFDKIIPRFETVLVKFDASYPYGDKHEAFSSVAAELKNSHDILFAEVGIKDWGEQENQKLAERFGIKSKQEWPALRLFVKGEDEPFSFNSNHLWTADEIKKFIREHSNIYLGLQGCIERFDRLAAEFAASSNKKEIIQKAETELSKLKRESEKKSAAVYVKFMNKVLEKESFVQDETKRLKKIITEGKVKADKRKDLQIRANILSSFNPIRSEL
ncbi:endoplasmic reticulum resident protein 29 [Sitophilus oryzae]|uniref:Endoplasmic reticulum resident protein 29 n=1 Tax=Sitophilus oryzae TaxID=7048 RepID=A0A6J2XYG9_SITOR|nr:endoplasmic reticulum resident protein 29 [Sitophilus oryzae]